MNSIKMLKSLPCIGIILLLIMPLCVHATFKSDTLVLDFKKSSPNYSSSVSTGLGFSLTKTFEQHQLKVKYADSILFAHKSYNDNHWKLDTTSLVNAKVGSHVYWYRFKLKVTEAYVKQPFVVLFDGEGALEMYLEGSLKAKIGTIPVSEKDKVTPQYFGAHPIILSFDQAGTYQIALRYKGNIMPNSRYDTWFQLRVLDAKYYFKTVKIGGIYISVFAVGIGTVFFTLFILHFLFFLFYKKEKANLFFAIFTLSIAVVLYAMYAYYHSESTALEKFYILTINFIPIVSCFSLSAFTTYIFSKSKITFPIIISATAVALVMALLDYYEIITFSYIIIMSLLAGSVLYTIVMIVRSIIQRQPGSLVLGSGVLFFCLFLLFLLVYAILNNGIIFDNTLTLLSLVAIFSIPISISAYLAWRFSITNKSLSTQLHNVELLSSEKQEILQMQNETLELQVSERTQELRQEKKKSDDLLLNILPHEIAEELKATGKSKAQLYDEVSVIFTDFVNFTQISEKLGVDELLEELNINFTAFDGIMEQYGLEKIKTIGDAYLAVSGLPMANEHHAQNAVLAALDIIKFVQQRRAQVDYGLDIRIGINSGSLIAGIIGVKKFAYDIWGDTVNIAARMEQRSEPGKVNISASTFELIKDDFSCEHRGKIDAKHKGVMDMYFVKGKK